MKSILLIFIGMFLSSPIFAQNYSIKGTVKDLSGNPIEYATVQIKGTSKGSITNKKGLFEINTNNKFPITLVSGYIGYTKKEITLENIESISNVEIQLAQDIKSLQSVEIIGRAERDYKNTNSFIGTKMETSIIDVPQSISYVTKELLADQAAYTVNDAVKNISGVNQFSFYNDVSIRGFRVSGQGTSGNLLNGMREFSGFWKQQLTPYLERVEVIKGPASALYGNASPGGTINRVTKKPLSEDRRSISATVGSYNTFRGLIDVTGPMSASEKLLYRINVGYENSESFRDLQFSKNFIVAPSFSFIPNEKTMLNFDVVYQNSKGRLDRGQAVFGDKDLYSAPISLSLSALNDHLNEEAINSTISFKHQLRSNLSINMAYMFSRYDEDLLEHRTSNKYASLADGSLDPKRVEMRVFERKRTWTNNNFSNFLNWDITTGPIEHKVLLGYDYFIQQQLPGGSQLEAMGYLGADGKTVYSTFKPSDIHLYALDAQGNPIPNVGHFDLTSTTANDMRDMSKYIYNKKTHYQKSKLATHGIYIQDQLKWKSLTLLLGLRQEYFDDWINYGTDKEEKVAQKALIPRIGLVYSVMKNFNIYGTYVGGYEPQTSSVLSNPNSGGPFDPLVSSLYELGTKSEWFKGRLSTTLAIYYLTQKGSLYSANNSSNPDLMLQMGEEVSKGLEVDFVGRITKDWSMVVGYAFNDAKITKSKNEKEIGIQKPNAPRHTFNFWTKYVLDKTMFKGLGFGFGTNYVSERLGSIPANGVSQVFPEYILLNAAVYYKIDDFQLQVNINNLTNKTHWVGGYDYLRAFPGEPRSIRFTISYNI